ncbi:MAG: carboxypeptidase regulatory-like domain-containing protein [Acidimicrobiales bacterium]|nr:carboxypeptidase regulatory-like domain-containing protein [Acidimicrobiales bacterium]
MRANRSARWAAAALVTSLAVAACTTSEQPPPPLALPAASTVPPPPLTTLVPPDTRGATLRAVEGRPPAAPTPAVQGGTSALAGLVRGPEGPVAGATVRLERFVGESSETIDVTTAADGRWEVRDARGGRYRVRAWRVPDLAQDGATVTFVAAASSATIDLQVQAHEGLEAQAGVSPGQVAVGSSLTLVALLLEPQVDGQGIVRGTPVAGLATTLDAGSRWRPAGSTVATTGSDGTVRWTLTCLSESGGSASLTADGRSFPLQLPACLPEPSSTTASTSTTSTTLPPPTAAFPMGETFKPPYAGPIPAGTYTVTASPGGNCALTYEPWTSTGWSGSTRTATGTPLVLTSPARDLRPSGDLPACSYTRTA